MRAGDLLKSASESLHQRGRRGLGREQKFSLTFAGRRPSLEQMQPS